ncbi:MAG: biopolymer transporter ExbD [Pirellulaceae bacterium]|nr:MAG: biopolymer transporter ExbD [Pirellulaceae bacterium]
MPLKTSHDELPAVNLTSLIDVLFLLIIFFMAGSSFEWEQNLPVDLPQVPSTATTTPHSHGHLIYIDSSGTIWLDGSVVPGEKLAERLVAIRESTAGARVTIRGDSQCPLQSLAVVLSACRQAGIEQTGLAVRPLSVAHQREASELRMR